MVQVDIWYLNWLQQLAWIRFICAFTARFLQAFLDWIRASSDSQEVLRLQHCSETTEEDEEKKIEVLKEKEAFGRAQVLEIVSILAIKHFSDKSTWRGRMKLPKYHKCFREFWENHIDKKYVEKT